jgi:Stage II sporulation protein E (SpoIIE)
MASRSSRSYTEVDHWQTAKHGQLASGDVFLCQKIQEEDRVIAVLSDGLGSGIKASVLATLTATMALKYTSSFMDIRRSAETIMDTLPICSVRQISYSTFTIVDLHGSGAVRIIEYDNPAFLLVRDGRVEAVESSEIGLDRWQDRTLRYAEFHMRLGDRIVFFSDGVSQAGTGEYRTPIGWGRAAVAAFVERETSADSRISARELAQKVVHEANRLDGSAARDDTTAGVIYFRQPRRLLVIAGPPFSQARDWELADLAETFPGRKVICGGTTANILARLLHKDVRTEVAECDPEIPPAARMDGIDLVTEGTLTLGRVATLLESGLEQAALRANAAARLAQMLLASDVVQFAVGTRINQAHQDPNIPGELDLRRNIVKKIGRLLEQRFLTEVHIQYR